MQLIKKMGFTVLHVSCVLFCQQLDKNSHYPNPKNPIGFFGFY